MDKLATLAKKFGCDKLGFEKFYDIFFEKFRDKEIKLFEIGILDGASIVMWYEYFSKARIVGIDISSCELRKGQDRITLYSLSQTNEKGLQSLMDEIGFQDIIIDDGSHKGTDIVTSLNILKNYINIGGYYCIEDILPQNKEIVDDYTNKLLSTGKFRMVLTWCTDDKNHDQHFYILERIPCKPHFTRDTKTQNNKSYVSISDIDSELNLSKTSTSTSVTMESSDWS